MPDNDADGFEARRAAGHPPTDNEPIPVRMLIEADELILEFPVPLMAWRIPFADVQAFTDAIIDAVNREITGA